MSNGGLMVVRFVAAESTFFSKFINDTYNSELAKFLTSLYPSWFDHPD